MNIIQKTRHIKRNISSVLVGKEQMVDLIMIALINKGHILLEDVPGTGKTLLAKSVAKSMSGQFKRIQFTADVLPSDITGIQFFNPKLQDFQLRIGPVMTNILLADEINRATPRAQSSLLEIMEERQVTIEGETTKLPSPFIVIATQNPIESQGTFPLPEAQLDRFFMQIQTGYPTFEEEKRMISIYRKQEPLDQLEPVLTMQDLLQMQEMVKEVELSEEVEDYLLSIISATRASTYAEAGVSPRGTLAFMRAAQGHAFINGRMFVTPDDIKTMAPYILAHRLILSLEGSLRKTKHQVIGEILKSVDVPVEAGAKG